MWSSACMQVLWSAFHTINGLRLQPFLSCLNFQPRLLISTAAGCFGSLMNCPPRLKNGHVRGRRRRTNRFLASMSHEMSTPLNTIIGMTEALEGTEITPEQ